MKKIHIELEDLTKTLLHLKLIKKMDNYIDDRVDKIIEEMISQTLTNVEAELNKQNIDDKIEINLNTVNCEPTDITSYTIDYKNVIDIYNAANKLLC